MRTEPAFWDASVIGSRPPFIKRWPLAPVRVGGHHYAVNVELKELLLAGADSRGKGSLSNRGSQSIRRLSGFCTAPNKELVVNVWRTEGVESEPRITPKIGAFGRMP
jgi:hypothetical protein